MSIVYQFFLKKQKCVKKEPTKLGFSETIRDAFSRFLI